MNHRKIKNIIITGITGQDGIFLTKILNNSKGIKIYGLTRNTNHSNFYKKLHYLNAFEVKKNINLININLKDKAVVEKLIRDLKPEVIFNLSGPSSVYESIKNPIISDEIIDIFDNLVNSCITNKIFPIFFQASSSEMFGANKETVLRENSIFKPVSPYAKAKLKNHKKVISLRYKYDWNIVSGIMFNHESEFRNNDYLFQKIIDFLVNFNLSDQKKLEIGSLELTRDWSYAEDIAHGILTMTESGVKDDFILGSGIKSSIREILEISFEYFSLNWENFIEINENFLRQKDPLYRVSDPSKIYDTLGWKTTTSIEKIIEKMINFRKLYY